VEQLKLKVSQEHNSVHTSLFHDFIKGNEKKFSNKIYIQGSFDFLRYDHALLLAKIKAEYPESKLIVGAYNDITIVENTKNIPLSTFYERILGLWSLRPVDEVIFDPEFQISVDFVKRYEIDHVIKCDGLDVET